MIYKWNKEIKRQGSMSRTKSRKTIVKEIDKVSTQEANLSIKPANQVKESERKALAKTIDKLYVSFPPQMADSFHVMYEKEVAKKIKHLLS